MDRKKFKAKPELAEDLIIKNSRFGWVVADKTEVDDKLEVVMTRDKDIPNYKNIKKMEKQYWKLKNPFPVGLVIWAVLGTAFLIVRLTTSFTLNDLLWVGMALCYCIAVYHLFLFIAISLNRRKLVDALKDYSQMTLGMVPTLPYQVNIEPINEETGLIANNLEKILKHEKE